MNKGDLISAVATSNKTSQAEAKVLVEQVAAILRSTLLSGEEVTLPGIGKLKVTVRPGRAGRNPKTGEKIDIPSKRVVKFSPSALFKGVISPVN